MSAPVEVDVIGAGPAGLVTALMLARSGRFAPTVLESRTAERVRERARAGLLEARTVDLFDRLGVSARLRREGRQHHQCEFRIGWDDHAIDSITVDLAAHAGVSQWVYPQQEVVADLLDACQGAGVKLRFGVSAITMADLHTTRPHLRYRDDRWVLHDSAPRFVVGADGWRGISRSAFGQVDEMGVFHRRQPYAWLALLVAAPPVWDRIVYGVHPRGFAGQMLRTAAVTRYYLQVPIGTAPETVPEDWIWAELDARLGAAIDRGPILERSLVNMDTVLIEPMRHGSLFMAGDAAHLLPPIGGKGLNLAVADAAELATRLIAWVDGDEHAPDGYTGARLGDLYAVEEFSAELGALLHQPDAAARARLRHRLTDPEERVRFCRSYVGVGDLAPAPI